eukprot:2353581-Karenia_brevis.AAC.1
MAIAWNMDETSHQPRGTIIGTLSKAYWHRQEPSWPSTPGPCGQGRGWPKRIMRPISTLYANREGRMM